MKKTLALILAVAMLVLALPFAAYANPEDQALEFNYGSSGAYFLFTGVSGSSNLTVSFDLSMSPIDGELDFTLCNVVHFQQNVITINGTNTSYTWGAFDNRHWRKVDIISSGSRISVNLDGIEVASANASLSGALFFLANRGHILVDNFAPISAGLQLFFLNFEDEGEYLNHKSNDSSAIRGNVPEGSYYDYEQVNVPEDVSYIFDNPVNCAKLTVQTGVEMYRGDPDEDGKFTAKDFNIVKKYIAGNPPANTNETLADVNGDGSHTGKDLLRMKKVMAGTVDPLTVIVNSGGGSAEYAPTMQSAMLTASEATVEGIDATLAMDAIDPEDYPYAVITYMTPNSTEDHNSAAANASAFGAWGNLKQYSLTTDGRFHSEVVDLSDVSTWNGDAATLRFFAAANAGDRIYIASIIFCANMSKANSAVAARDAAMVNYKIVNEEPGPDPSGKIGYTDADGNYVIRFDTAAKINSNVTTVNNTSLSFEDESLKATATGTGDPGYCIDLSNEGISATTYKYIAYVYKNPNSNKSGKQANLYYVVPPITEFTGGYESDLFGGQRSGNYVVAIVDLSAKSNWAGALSKLRIDYFTDTSVNDVSYLDSIIFCRTSALAGKAGNDRLRDRNGVTENSTADIWNTYRWYYQNANSNEFISGSQTDLKMYFRYGSYDKFTARSLGDRFARAIQNATGYEVTAEVYSYTFCELRDNWSNEYPESYMFFTLRHDGEAYIIWVKVVIMKDSSYSDPLDGTPNDPYYDYPNNSTWNTSGYYITDSGNATTSSTYVAAHSNHENKIVKTPYGTFAVHHTSCPGGNDGNANYTGGGRAGVFRIYDNGSSRMIYEYDCTNHTTKPQIMYGDDGLVYFVQPDDGEGEGCNISLGYFDPSQPVGNDYNITYSRNSFAYPGGSAPGGYGYSCAYMDYHTGKIYCFYCGGRDEPGFWLCWKTYDYRTHNWVGGAHTVFNEYYRQCYLYAFSDNAGGIYLVAERACLLECLGLQNIVYGANYTWDEIALFHINNMSTGSSHSQLVIPADYTQMDRELFPNCHNASSDCYMTSDRKLHVIWQVEMHGRYHHDTRYNAIWHVVYDCATAGQEPTLITKEPISFIASDNFYTMRFVENTSGQIFLLAMPNSRDARCEVWKATNALATEFELVACRNFSDTDKPTTGMLVPNTRTHSIYDNTIPVLYPLSRSPGVVYKSFFVTLPANAN